MRFALDTNTVIAALKQEARVVDRLDQFRPSDVGIPIVVLAELLYGAYHSRRREENLKRVEDLHRRFPVLELTIEVAHKYGSIRAELVTRGLIKSDFDMVIASIAVVAGATLVTDDHALLDGKIPGLNSENWLTR